MDDLLSHHYRDTLKINPFERYQSLMGYDHDEWIVLRDKILEYMESLFIVKDGQKYLPKGTMLYQGSLNYPFQPGSLSTGNQNAISFFGLDTTISLWYILELMQDSENLSKKEYPRFGYLYAFRLTKDLPISKTINTIYENPKDIFHCKMYKRNVCIGPQISRRGNFSSFVPELYNLSLELTLFYNHYKEYLTLENTYLVDPLALKLHDNDTSFEPQESILQKIDEYKSEYDQKIDVETFYRYYIDDDNYLCKYDCGYRGTYSDVLEHERICKYKKGGKKGGKKIKYKKLTKNGEKWAEAAKNDMIKRTKHKIKSKKNDKYKSLLNKKKLTKREKKWLNKKLHKNLCKCIKTVKNKSKKNKRYKKASEYPICLSSIYLKRDKKPPKNAIKKC